MTAFTERSEKWPGFPWLTYLDAGDGGARYIGTARISRMLFGYSDLAIIASDISTLYRTEDHLGNTCTTSSL